VKCSRRYHSRRCSAVSSTPFIPNQAPIFDVRSSSVSSHKPTAQSQPPQHTRDDQQQCRHGKHSDHFLHSIPNIIRPCHVQVQLAFLIGIARVMLSARYVLDQRIAVRLPDCYCVWRRCFAGVRWIMWIRRFCRVTSIVGREEQVCKRDVVRIWCLRW
jgi:hypothetical protein